MKAIQENTRFAVELMAELREAADKLAWGNRDPAAAKQAAQRMDRMREANRQRLGVQNIGVDSIRQMREGR